MDSRIPRSTLIGPTPTAQLPTIGGKYFALAVLFLMNLLNYVDRYSFFAAGTHIQKALDISDFRYGILGAAFMIVYTIVSPAMGWMGDRFNRKVLIAGGVGLWSLATVGTAFSENYAHMFFWRALLGIGEASYGVIAPALLSDLFPVRSRGRAMGVYYLALPVGTALGFKLGGMIADDFGWRAVFFVVGLPGLVAAALGLIMVDPGRGASEEGSAAAKAGRPTLQEYLDLFRTRTFVYNTAGMAAVTFATGAYAAWGSTFYSARARPDSDQSRRRDRPFARVCGHPRNHYGHVSPRPHSAVYQESLSPPRRDRRLWCHSLGSVRYSRAQLSGLAALPVRGIDPLIDGLGAVQYGHGQCGATKPPRRRVRFIHLFDPSVRRHQFTNPAGMDLGHVRDAPVAESPIGQLCAAIGAVPVDNTNLTAAMLSVAPVLFLGFVFFAIGARYLPSDQEKARGAAGESPGQTSAFHH